MDESQGTRVKKEGRSMRSVTQQMQAATTSLRWSTGAGAADHLHGDGAADAQGRTSTCESRPKRTQGDEEAESGLHRRGWWAVDQLSVRRTRAFAEALNAAWGAEPNPRS